MSGHAAAYLRRSSVSTENPGDASREAQEAAVRSLCGDDVVLYVDWGISGRKNDRPEYVKLKAAIAAGEVASVCAYSLSRLGRNARELLAFVELCQSHGVTIRTKTEGLETSSAFGRAMLGIMAVFAQLEVEQGMERSAAAREARQARCQAAGVELLGSRPLYGFRHVKGPDGVFRREADPEHPIGPILAAYRDAGSVRGACELLQARGVPSPEGGKVWGSSTLTRILREHGAALPEPRGKDGHRRPVKPSGAIYSGLLRCHCGRSMTPNVVRGQYYCAAGRDSGAAAHGKYSVTEKALRAALDPIAALYTTRAILPAFKDSRNEAERTGIDMRKARVGLRFEIGEITADAYRRRVAELDAQLARLSRETRVIASLRLEHVPDPSDVPAFNAHLRRLWSSVQLGPDLLPADGGVEWAVPAYMYDVAAFDAYEAEIEAANRDREG